MDTVYSVHHKLRSYKGVAKKEEAVYLVGDASSTGMVSVFWVQGGEVIKAEFGTWREIVTEGKLLNFRMIHR